jgi:hypothetical protein
MARGVFGSSARRPRFIATIGVRARVRRNVGAIVGVFGTRSERGRSRVPNADRDNMRRCVAAACFT